MIFVLGLKTLGRRLGTLRELRQCENCHELSHWYVVRRVPCISFFTLPLVPLMSRKHLVCPVCGAYMGDARDVDYECEDLFRP